MCIVNVVDTSEIGNLVEEFSSCVYEDESVKVKYLEVLVLVEAELVMEGDEPFAVGDDSMFEEVLF